MTSSTRIILTALILGLSSISKAATFYWIASSDGNWSNANNWSLSSGGSPTTSYPSASTDNAVFDGNSTANCFLDLSVTINSFTMAGYSKTLSINNSLTLRLTSITQSSGIISSVGTGQLYSTGSTASFSNASFNCSAYLNLSSITMTNMTCSNAGQSITFAPISSCSVSSTKFYIGTFFVANSFSPITLTNNFYYSPVNWSSTGGQIRASSETYHTDVTISNGSSATMQPAYAGNNYYFGNLTVGNSASGIIGFGGNGGKTFFADSINHNNLIQALNNGQYIFRNLTYTASQPFSVNSPNANFKFLSVSFTSKFTLTCSTLTIDKNGSFGTNTFNGDVDITMSGSSANHSITSSTFAGNSKFTVNNSGTLKLPSTGQNIFGTNSSNQSTFYLNASTLTENGSDVFNCPTAFHTSTGSTLNIAQTGSPSFNSDLTIDAAAPTNVGTSGGTIIFGGTGNRNYTDQNGNVSIQNVNFNFSGGYLTLLSNISFTQTVTFTSGIVQCVITPGLSDYASFASGVILSGVSNSSYIDGVVYKTGGEAFTFPIGESGYYRPLSMSAPSDPSTTCRAQYHLRSASTDGYAMSVTSPLTRVSDCEFWYFAYTAGSITNVTLTLSWNSQACNYSGYVDDPSTLAVAVNDNTSWRNLGNGGTSFSALSSGTVQAAMTGSAFPNGGSTGATYAITLASTSANNPLPVTLIDFTADAVDAAVRLKWSTASEINCSSYVVEKGDGKVFIRLCEVPGNGTTKALSKYSLDDTNPIEGTSYYKLTQIDFDGKATVLGIVSINFQPANDDGIVVYPNPAQNKILFSRSTHARIFDIHGNLILTTSNSVEFVDISSVPQGIFIVITDDGRRHKLSVAR